VRSQAYTVGRDPTNDGRLVGLNLAARIADYARPGEVVVSEEVVEAADGAPVWFEEIGPVELKGIKGALQLHTAHRDASMARKARGIQRHQPDPFDHLSYDGTVPSTRHDESGHAGLRAEMGRPKEGWPAWVPWAAAAWSLGYGTLGLFWALGAPGFPFGPANDPARR